MIQLVIELHRAPGDPFEDRFMEMEFPSWTIREDRLRQRLDLIGYFDTEADGLASFAEVRKNFPDLPETPLITPVLDRDWKEAYRDHFQPWCHGGLHWVPMWLRQTYPLPQGAKAVYLDPGMAFGTGNHETTRLCAIRLVETAAEWKDRLHERSTIDAGCGSGILAISASLLGFGEVSGFDIDEAAVQVAKENAAANNAAQDIAFTTGGIEQGLSGKMADVVLANILSNILIKYADDLLKSVKPGGRLILSGILAREVGDVKAVFEPHARALWTACDVRSRIDGEWADLMLVRPSRAL
jgi:ribosomal protein L11 methyltransferase